MMAWGHWERKGDVVWGSSVIMKTNLRMSRLPSESMNTLLRFPDVFQ
jgi:hypothetical protein